jgi:DNA-binding NtrC family response regulator
MPSIAIIDDRKGMRDTVRLNVAAEIEDGWDIIDIEPLPYLADYPSWIDEKNVAVILLDERLNDQSASNYQGHDLVTYIRKRLPTLPIFIITSYASDDEIQEKFKDVEEILQREDFTQYAEKYVPRFTRAGQRFVEVFENELSELSDKARKIAKGDATPEDIKRVKAIQSRMDIAYSDTLCERNQSIKDLNDTISEFNRLKSEIDQFLASK